jgi:thioredoxin reductase (NADPH)
MSEYLVARIEDDPKIEVRTCTEVVGADGDEHLEQLDLRDNAAAPSSGSKAGWLFVFIGAVPRTDWLGERFAADGRGFVLTGSGCSTTTAARRPTGPSSATRTCSSRACRACSSPVTCAPRR